MEAAKTVEEMVDSVVGAGMVYMMHLSARLSNYRRSKDLMKDQNFKMIEVVRFTEESVCPIGFNVGDTSFIFEYALHEFVEEYSEDFFTHPGVNVCAMFLNHRAIDFVDSNPWLKLYGRELLIDSLKSKQYVGEGEVSILCKSLINCFRLGAQIVLKSKQLDRI